MLRPRSLLHALVAAFAVSSALHALARFATVHNETFDLAFYARMAWGLAGAELWEPIVGANVLGLHLSPILFPLGVLGRLTSTVHVLLVTQAIAVATSAYPIARIARRHLGHQASFVVAAGYLLHPNLFHVATFEFHPGTVAVLPLAAAIDAVDRRSPRQFLWSAVAVLACREDLALPIVLLSVLGYRGSDRFSRVARSTGIASLAWILVFTFVLHPIFAPLEGSLEAHFAKWGTSTFAVLAAWMTRPLDVLSHLGTADRIGYLPLILAPVAFLPLARLRYLVPALPILAINLMSDFPGTRDLESHYLTPAIPFIGASAVLGASRLANLVASRRRSVERIVRPTIQYSLVGVWLVAGLIGHLVKGGSPLSLDFEGADFRSDARTAAALHVIERTPADLSLQAPEPLLAHLIERRFLHRAPPPEMKSDLVILDLSHRLRFFGDESVLRTTEEPTVRAWLARPDHRIRAAALPYVLLEKGGDPRKSEVLERYLVGSAPASSGTALTACLRLRNARPAEGERLVLELVATGPCPADLAIRIGVDARPAWVELLFDGILSPAHLRAGDRLRSTHLVIGSSTSDAVTVGAVRSSGARPDHGDPWAIRIPITRPNHRRPRG